jgi:hypothetical protein
MNDEEFARLVEQAGVTKAVPARTLDQLVEQTRPVGRRRRGGRRPTMVTVAVAGAVLLAAAASTSYALKIPPFQGLDNDMYRTQTAIPVDFTMQSGQRVHCQAFLEFRYLSNAQAAQADRYVQQHDWSGFGQSLYDDGVEPGESYEDAQTRIYDALTPILRRNAHIAVPSAVEPSQKAEDDHLALVSGSSAICRRVTK